MPLDAQAAAFVQMVTDLGGPQLEDLPVDKAREVSAEAWGAPPTGLTLIEDTTCPGPNGDLALRIYRPKSVAGPLPCLVFFHGGGWVLCTIDTHNFPCEELASRTPCVVVSVGYGLSPENPFPGPIDDCWAATKWVAENAAKLGIEGPVALGGDSAGGHLSAAVALRARDAGLPIALQLLIYPVTDGGCDSASYREFADGYLLTAKGMEWFWDLFVGPGGDRLSPEASPLRAPDLKGVAPAFVLTAECDVLRDEGEAYAARLQEAGVATRVHRFPGQLHGFFTLKDQFDATAVAHDMAAAALREAFGGAR